MSKPQKAKHPPDWQGFAQALKDIVDWGNANKTSIAVVGGLAVGAHSVPRATKDVDVTVVTSDDAGKVLASVKEFGFTSLFDESLKLGVEAGVMPLSHSPTGAILDLIFARFPFQQEMVARALIVEFNGVDVPIVQLEDLCAMKFFASRPQDIVDVRSLLRANPTMDRELVLEYVQAYSQLIEEPELYDAAASMMREQSNDPDF